MSDKIKYPEVLPFDPTGCKATVEFEADVTIKLNNSEEKAELKVAYAPDKSTLRQDQFQEFLKAFSQHATLTPETYVSHLAAALYDTLVPYKVKVKAEIKYGNLKQEVSAEKAQPGY